MSDADTDYPDNTGEVIVRLVGLETEPTEPTIVGFIVRGNNEDPFLLVRAACEVVGDRLQHLGRCYEVKTECMGGPWEAQIIESEWAGATWEPLSLDEVGVSENEAAQVIYDLRRTLDQLQDRHNDALSAITALTGCLRRLLGDGLGMVGKAADDFERAQRYIGLLGSAEQVRFPNEH